jgi:uncharacterized radical SAM superfamily Fe-S cluster-containing enzyme
MAETSAALAKVGTFASEIFLQCRVVVFLCSSRRGRIRGLECSLARLTIVNVRKKIEVIVEEVYTLVSWGKELNAA